MTDVNFDGSTVEEVKQEPDFEKFDYGHLIKECLKCGHKEVMDKDVEGGINMYLPTTDKHELRLLCENCGNTIRMFYMKSDKVKPPKEPDSEKPEEVIEEKRKRRKVKKNEVSKSSKEEEPIPTSS